MEIAEEIANFPTEYKEMMKGKLSKRQLEILDGDELKSHEGMVFGQMYADWKLRREFDWV
tara:strand:- start:380 stop:559 length:180 start_codon:yes stop_codon:yes gene_type:complete